jgi:hypothetical protein
MVKRSSLYQQTFPEVAITKKLKDGIVMKITISSRAPARMAYNQMQEKLLITFWYEPYPFIEGWLPKYRGKGEAKGKCKKKGYWEEKNL